MLLIAFVICLCAQPAAAATDDSLFSWRRLPDGSGVQLVHYNGTGIADIVVPESVNGMPVFSIGPDAFVLQPEGDNEIEPRSDIRSIYIPDTVTDIGEYAFWQLSSLESIHLPSGLTSLSDGLLCGCTSLRSLELPAGLTSVGAGALSGLESIAELRLPSSVLSIGEAAFANDYALEFVTLPEHLGEIPGWAFKNCTSLPAIKIPRWTVRIGEEAFAGCTGLRIVDMYPSLRGVGTLAFSNCPNLSDVLYWGTQSQFERIYFQEPRTPEGCALLYANIECIGDNEEPTVPTDPTLPDDIYVRADSALKLVSSGDSIFGVGYTAASTRPEALHAEFLEAQFVHPQEVSIAITSPDGTLLGPEDVCGTGTIVSFSEDDEPLATVTLVVAGDVTGSGVVSLTQLVRMAQAMNGSTVLTGPYLAAGDFTDTGSITLTDLVRESQLLASANAR